ncbi:MAG: UDP-N-acetylmuramoyl-L-alanine--D-glutamate ligase [Firmicutes bacterium]|nr:UDP-N-acetylmuramoyl-L-alanine--D-glutamate ligase [Bacillota bacterium]
MKNSLNVSQFKKQLHGKKVAVLGIGVSNIPLIKILSQYGATVIARDKKTREQLGGIANELSNIGVRLVLGADYLENLDEKLIFRTPGLKINTPQLVEAKKNGAEITSEMEVFFRLCPAKIIAVTGSDGKTTTTTLIYKILSEAGYKCHVGGNIGKPLLCDVESISAEDKVILELSSFQLQTMITSPHIAVVTNVTPNHLDYHETFDEYIKSKENIYLHQISCDKLVVNSDNKITKGFISKAKGEVITFGASADSNITISNNNICINGLPVLNCNDILLSGAHNKENYMAAIGAVWGAADSSAIQKVAKTFAGVEHRIEFVREIEGVRYYNDSIATTPSRAAACLKSFNKKIIVIAGGFDKKIPFDTFAHDSVKYAKALILIGQTAATIKNEVLSLKGEKPQIIMSKTLDDAVLKAKSIAQRGDVVALTPACASFDMFDNFEQRGNHFKKMVMSL